MCNFITTDKELVSNCFLALQYSVLQSLCFKNLLFAKACRKRTVAPNNAIFPQMECNLVSVSSLSTFAIKILFVFVECWVNRLIKSKIHTIKRDNMDSIISFFIRGPNDYFGFQCSKLFGIELRPFVSNLLVHFKAFEFFFMRICLLT